MKPSTNEDLHEDLVEHAGTPVFAVDPKGRILTWNWGCELVFGSVQEQAVGRFVEEFTAHKESAENWRKSLIEAVGTDWAVCDLDLLRGDTGDTVHARFVIRATGRGQGKDKDTLAVTVMDRTEIQRLEEQLYHQIWALTESEERLRNLVPDAVVVMDEDGRIETVNELTERMFGYGQEDLVGQSIGRLIPGLLERHRNALFHEAFESPVVLPTRKSSLEGIHKQGMRFPVEISLGPVPKDGRTWVTAAIRDITDQVQARQSIAEVERLKELDRFKARFINTAAHELKTPLTTMNLQLHLLREERNGPLNESQRKHTETLQRNLDRFNRLVEDLLDAARLQSQRLYLNREEVEPVRLVSDVVDNFRDLARQKGLELVFDAGKTPRLSADPGRLEQVLYNLLNNAIKFTPEGGRVEVSTSTEGDRAIFQVSDTGIGLSQDQIDRLFQPFIQVHEDRQVQKQGTGLGLYLSRRLVELHGGRLSCSSEGPGKGATFRFEIPGEGAPRSTPGPVEGSAIWH